MEIKIANRHRPFSHKPGSKCLIPESSWCAAIYPLRLKLFNLKTHLSPGHIEIAFAMQGPVKRFTIMQDLERKWIRVFGEAKEGFFSYRIMHRDNALVLKVERCADEGMTFTVEMIDGAEIDVPHFHHMLPNTFSLQRKESLGFLIGDKAIEKVGLERLSFGCNKAQDWQLIRRRANVIEFLPIWYHLAQVLPEVENLETGFSNYHLFEKCQKLVEKKECDQIGEAFLQLFDVGFEGIFTPRLEDTDYLMHYQKVKPSKKASPLMLLHLGAKLIRDLFIKKEKNVIHLLPCLPKEIHSGRFLDVKLDDDLKIDLEWSKKKLRRMVVRTKVESTYQFSFQNDLKDFRLRTSIKDRGQRFSTFDPIELKGSSEYFFDRFQK